MSTPSSRPQSRPKPFQFTLRTALLLPALCALTFAIAQWAGTLSAIAFALLVINLAAAIFRLRYGSRSQRYLSVLVFTAIVSSAVALLLPAWPRRFPVPSYRSACCNNLRQIGIALESYHDLYGSFPPAYLADSTGKPMHSWRVLLLPFLDGQHIYKQYNFNEPWDGPNNRRLAEFLPHYYGCPSGKRPHPGMTSYLAITGRGTAFDGPRDITVCEITDPHDATLLIAEVADSGINWMEPRDLRFDEMSFSVNHPFGPAIRSPHCTGANALLANTEARFLPESTPSEKLRSMLTIAGAEDTSP